MKDLITETTKFCLFFSSSCYCLPYINQNKGDRTYFVHYNILNMFTFDVFSVGVSRLYFVKVVSLDF